MTSQHERAVAFAALHQSGTFVVPNPWDAGTARILTGFGFSALATTSAGLAFALGRRDGANLVSPHETVANAAQIAAATHLPVSADLENGGPAIGDIAMTIREAAASGLVGGSIEDATGRPEAPIFPLAEAVDRITAAVHTARDLPFPFTLTARAENFLYGRPDLADTIARLTAYAEAGADVVYAPGLPDADAVRAVCAAVDRPVNLLAAGFVLNHSVAEIAQWGVRRISLGSAMARAALGAFVNGAREIAHQGTFGFANQAIPYGDANALFPLG
ncbi:isocitrate lyase/phosphoenolpyruvate mutase family protein [Mycobacterium sp. CBMA271]|uniref:isocitrate lyase/PEP mutase family protein n=1 Tax=unclassified Mycobacteroides TaxID=2618759 RepID=UPI0012DEF6B7|nr:MULTISPECIES: isocitrate lyase/phosphoenolpyruvate mutase family protein [unclassified Mycobacteroides]MUM15742.1 2-methylisocitrate lyase [Mycobacteroides sp. CBMA 326]MUM21129.1 isocitrate lyase/phosphoenolpyruvate mutase family protein [Mycobacteroides sp. CBMA 271]